jgi:DNA-binding MarR family transcriptional regulator
MSAGDLMEAAFLTSGSVTAMLTRMQEQGWVTRKPAALDQRRTEVQLTAKGMRRIEPAISERVTDNIAIARRLPPDARAQIDGLLRQLLAALEAPSPTKDAT